MAEQSFFEASNDGVVLFKDMATVQAAASEASITDVDTRPPPGQGSCGGGSIQVVNRRRREHPNRAASLWAAACAMPTAPNHPRSGAR